jgi:MarR family transcriptional regulator, temperature-dependent positive regulator of motility
MATASTATPKKSTAEEARTGLVALLIRVAKGTYRRADEGVLGLRLKEYIALQYLSDQGKTAQADLGEQLMLDANNCVILLNGLEEGGYVERRRDPNDRRRHIVEMTKAGERALEKADRAFAGLEDEVFAGLSVDERCQLWNLLRQALDGGAEPAH